MKFSDFKLNENLQRGIDEAGFSECMPVQAETLAHSLKGRDVLVQSQTGSGKTAAFLVTIFQHFLDENSPIKKKRAIIITPTRELAVQIEKDAKQIGRYLTFSIGSFYGGVGYGQQEQMLDNRVDIIVGTPGRLLDFSHKGKVDFNSLGFFIIDEADRMFDMGFLADIRQILDQVSSRSQRMYMLFSATLDVRTIAVAYEYMKDPAKVEITPEQVTVKTITQVLYHVAEKEKLSLILGIFKKEMPRNALIFTNTRQSAAYVAKHLDHHGYKCQYLNGDLPQAKRLGVINHFKAGKLSYLVATDVAARGLHIEDLEMVINYDLPGDCENYVHRIGRTARVGKEGKAISLVCERFVYNLEAIENFIGMKIPIGFAGDDLYAFERRAAAGENGEPMGTDERRPRHTTSHTHVRRPARSTKKPTTPPSPSRPQKKKFSYDEKMEQQRKKNAEQMEDKQKSKPKHYPEHKETVDRRYSNRKKSKPKTAEPAEKTPHNRVPSPGNKRGNLEDRLEYYKKKYGDNFQVKKPESQPVSHHQPPPIQAKKSLFKRIASIFKRKK